MWNTWNAVCNTSNWKVSTRSEPSSSQLRGRSKFTLWESTTSVGGITPHEVAGKTLVAVKIGYDLGLWFYRKLKSAVMSHVIQAAKNESYLGLIPTPSLSFGVAVVCSAPSVCLFVCLSVCQAVCLQHNSTRRMATANKTCVSGKN